MTFILHETSRQHYWSGVGSLSIKTFFKGRATYRAQGLHVVDDQRYLILNHQQPYTVEIDVPTPIESFCIFLGAGLAEDVYRAMTTPPTHLLDDPTPTLPLLEFVERTYPHDRLVSDELLRLRAASTAGTISPGWLEEQLHLLARGMVQMHYGVAREIENFPAARPATRIELYRRLHLAYDYIVASFHLPLTLDDIARVACLSPNHLLRTFRHLFQQTPHQFLTACRLNEAQRLLRDTDFSITDICLMVGFESLGSFSSLFSRQVGLSPQAYRQKIG
jgi:AraC family transcriptional regulator